MVYPKGGAIMATYKVTSPDGDVYEVTAPDNASEEMVFEYAKKQFNAQKQTPKAESQKPKEDRGSFFDPLMQGLTYGWADELGGLGARIGAGLAGSNETRRDIVAQKETNRQRAQLADYRQRNPYTSAGLEIGGALVSGGPAVKYGTTGLRLLGLGALEGGIAGAGAADENKVTGAATGAALGGVMGGAVPALGYAARKGGGYIARKVAPVYRRLTEQPQTTAQRVLTDAMRSEGITPAMLKSRARQMGQDATLVDIGGSKAVGLGQGVIDADTTGDALALARRTYGKRAAGQTARLERGINKATGNKHRFLSVLDEINDRQRQASSAAYDAAFNSPSFNPVDKDLIDLINRPGIKRQLGKALDDAVNEGRSVPALEKIVMQGDNVKIGKELMPDMQGWDAIKRRLDKAVTSAYRTSDPGASSLKVLRNKLRDVLDDVNPEYKAARNIYAGDAALKDALSEGESFLTRKTREVRAVIRDLSESEKEAYLTGAVEAIKEKMGRARAGEMGSFRFLETGNAKEKLRMLFPAGRDGDREMSRLMRILNTERKFATTQGEIVGNSATALRQAGGRMLKSQTAMPTTAEALTHPIRGGIGAGVKAASDAAARLSDKSIGELARLLYTPGNVEAVIVELEKRGVPKQVIQQYVNKFSKASAAAAPVVGLAAGSAAE